MKQRIKRDPAKRSQKRQTDGGRVSAFFKKYGHAWILSYFLIYLPWFSRLQANVGKPYHVIHSKLDDLIPFEELKIYKRICWTDTVITILPFCRHERYGYGLEVSRYHKSKDIMSNDNLEDPQMWGFYISPETRKEEKHLGIMHPTAEQSVGA